MTCTIMLALDTSTNHVCKPGKGIVLLPIIAAGNARWLHMLKFQWPTAEDLAPVGARHSRPGTTHIYEVLHCKAGIRVKKQAQQTCC